VGRPSSDEYWHIGETKTRFLKVRSRSVKGEKRWDMAAISSGRWFPV
jgi:hypothetical protein